MSDVSLINRLLRDHTAETEWLEFKRDFGEPYQIGEYLSALANAACIHRRSAGYLVFGIDDATHAVVGTNFDPYQVKAKGNQDLLLWLRTKLRPDTEFAARDVTHPILQEMRRSGVIRNQGSRARQAWVPSETHMGTVVTVRRGSDQAG